MTNTFKELAHPIKASATIVWAGFLAAPVWYLVAAWLIASGGPPAAFAQALRWPLYGLAVAAAIGAWHVYRRAGSGERIRAQLAPPFDAEAFATHPKTGRVDGERLEKLRGLAPDEQRALRLLAWWQSQQIVAWALAEAPAVLGLVTGLLVGRLEPVVLLVAISWVLLVATRPRLDDLRREAGADDALVASHLT